ncbi:MAG: HD domain-containing protein [Bacteroidales bacterium]|nr:HD domain-containing protein [Clostridium sp.]MCM1203234.1 HD domain-containing protein [Bacteroidales bacterium]
MKQFNRLKSFLRIGIGLISLFSFWLMPVRCLADGAQGIEDWMKTVYNADNGLPTGEANAVLQTRDGYIWIGSYGGLIRYDGVSFKNFSAEEGTLESSSIRALYEGSDGRLYVGTNDMGVYIYQNGEFTRVSYEGGDDAFYSVRSFAETSEGVIYAGTTSGLARIRTEDGVSTLAAVPDTAGNIVYDLACDKNDSLWLCSDNGAIIIVREDAVFTVTDASAWMEEECYSVLAGSDGSVYLGSSSDEVVRLQMQDDNYKKTSFTSDSVSAAGLHTVNDLYEDRDGDIWVLADNGIGCFQGADMDGTGKGAFRIPSVMQEIPSVCSMIQDYEGNLWTASTKTGVNYFSHGKYTNFNQSGNLENTAVNAIVQDEGYSYIATDQGLVILNRSYKRVTNALTAELGDKRVRHIACAQDGTLWFSLYGDGLAEYHPGSGSVKLYTEENGLASNQVRMTLPLSDGSLAIAESSGIDIWENGKVIRSYGEEQLPYPFILCMYEAEDGTLVAGSDGMGIYTIKGSEIRQYYQDEGLESGIILRMMPDEEAEGVWVSAGNALYFWDESGIKRMPFHDGAGSILDIQVIGDKLWLMKSNGPLIVDKAKLTDENYEARELAKEYGLTGTLVANSWNYMTENGDLWLCTNNGISVINTRELPMNEEAPKGAVTQITVDEDTVVAPEEIQLPAAARRITLDLAVMSYTLGDKSVEYYLEGFDEEKLNGNISEMSSISYTNLEGGDYVFHMTVYNEDGIEGDSCTVKIHKAYHFWELKWVRFLLILVLVALIAFAFQLGYRVKINGLKKRQAEYRSIIEQSLHTFANAIDAKDKDTNGHSGRVAVYSRELARRMKLPEEEQENVYYMALLHDIGKIGIPDSILKKNGKLTEEEWEIVKSHPVIGGEILKEFTAIPGIADGAKYHHEFYNGKGYCEGLQGEEIPLKARIIAVADAFDAMCSKRYYHAGTTIEHAREEIARCSGEQFDPEIALCMLEMIDEGFMDDRADV